MGSKLGQLKKEYNANVCRLFTKVLITKYYAPLISALNGCLMLLVMVTCIKFEVSSSGISIPYIISSYVDVGKSFCKVQVSTMRF